MKRPFGDKRIIGPVTGLYSSTHPHFRADAESPILWVNL